EQGCVPGGTGRNFESYGHLIGNISEMQRKLLCDPQTSGGLLLAVQPEAVEQVKEVAKRFNIDLTSIGELTEPKAGRALIEVTN
ncbi:selenide, water dikinase SelD, partial [Brucellaceae bacterium VT-16-1752]